LQSFHHDCLMVQVETEDEEWTEEFVGEQDPSILHFLLASGDQISSKQLRDDLMTLLIAGHEVHKNTAVRAEGLQLEGRAAKLCF
jgi:cytochrome P450